jgi:hypothetical protein
MLSTRQERIPSSQPHSNLWLQDTSVASERRLVALECALLCGLIAIVGWFVVPSHWTSIWMDREFTGWVAPVANRLGEIRLYADGGHIPMPPLPFVFMRLITGGQATWLCESRANFAFQALTLLMMYAGLRSAFRAPIPFLATVASIPVFFSLPKTIVYDSMAQFFAAVVAVAALGHSRRIKLRGLACEAGVHSRWSDWLSPSIVGMALAAALCLLSKQSTGGGACVGGAAALMLASNEPLRRRLLDVAIFAAWTLVLGCLLTLALSPWIDPVGLVRDVFLIGSEPKGGSLRLLKSLTYYGLEIGQQALLMAFTLIASLGVVLQGRDVRVRNEERTDTRDGARELHLLYVALTAVVTLFVALAASRMERLCAGFGTVAKQMLWMGLLLGLLTVRRANNDATKGRALLLVVLLGSALFHSLSTPRFRWTYDNNPLIVLAFALFLSASLDWLTCPRKGLDSPRGSNALTERMRSRVANRTTFVLLVVGIAWMQLGEQFAACRDCTENWGDVAYLAGAKLPAAAEGMHETVRLVRELAAEDETVLLLPNDPNVEAWFDRPRPSLSAPIVFADQYWDRLVDDDLASLRAGLPKVVVIGPRNYWRGFQAIWQPNYGAARLTETMLRDVIPEHYHLQQSVPITHRKQADFMDVYVRNR